MSDSTRHRSDDAGDGAHTIAGDGRWLPLGVAARVLGISRSSVYGRLRRGTLASRPLGNKGLEVLVPDAPHDVAGNGAHDGRGHGAGDISATLREELATARVTIGRLEERLTATEARAAVETGALREAMAKAEARADRLEAALVEARRPWLARVLEGLRRKG